MSEQTEELARAQELGCLKAKAFEHGLRDAEQREREARLARLAWSASIAGIADIADIAGIADIGNFPKGDDRLHREASASTVFRLEQDVERLAAFHQAVLHSRGWRVLQWLRRPFGRAW